MRDFQLGAAIYLGSVAIRVKDRDKMIGFYKNVVGFGLKREENKLAILGAGEAGSEMLLLEGGPRANDHMGEIKKLGRFSLIVPSTEELVDILCRIRETDYPIKGALEDRGRTEILFVDSKESELEIYYEKNKDDQREVPETMGREASLGKPEEKFSKLSAGSYSKKIHSGVTDLAKEHQLLDRVFGLKVHNEEEGIHILNEGNFYVGLTEASSGAVDLSIDEVVGLGFLEFMIDTESVERLIAHL